MDSIFERVTAFKTAPEHFITSVKELLANSLEQPDIEHWILVMEHDLGPDGVETSYSGFPAELGAFDTEEDKIVAYFKPDGVTFTDAMPEEFKAVTVEVRREILTWFGESSTN
jgi:hypothetical protein